MGEEINHSSFPSNGNARRIRVTAAVLTYQGKILIAQRKKGDRLAGKWEFPGGKIELGETPEACLKRELEEEFGIKSRIGEFICEVDYQYPKFRILLMAYHVNYTSGEFHLNDHAAIEWVTLEEIQNFDFSPADLPIIEALLT